MEFLLCMGLIFSQLVPAIAMCFNLGPFQISSNSITSLPNGFYGPLDVQNPSAGTEVELFISCVGSAVLTCKIVTTLSVVSTGTEGVAFTYGDIDPSQRTSTLMIAGGAYDLDGSYGTFIITSLVILPSTLGLPTSSISFVAVLDPCISGGSNPSLPSVVVTARTVGEVKMKISCGSNTNICFASGFDVGSCFISCQPADNLSVLCKAVGSIFTFEIDEKIDYSVADCSTNRRECEYETIVFNFDTEVLCSSLLTLRI